MDGIRKAITAAGSMSALARAVGVTYQTVSYWSKKGAPADWWGKIIAATDGAVTLEDLYGDIRAREREAVAE